MKKVILPLVGIFAVALGLFAYYGLRYADNLNFRTELATYLARATVADTLQAEQNGVSVSLPSGDGLLRVLSRGQSERKRLEAPPQEQDYFAKITLFLEDMTLSVYALAQDPETVVYGKDLNGSQRYYSLSGYDTYHWLCRTTGLPEAGRP